MKISALTPLILIALLLPSCAKFPEKRTDQEPVKETKYQEISTDTIAFIRMHPGAPQKNVYATWKHYENQDDKSQVWRIQKTDLSQTALAELENLFAAAGQNLIPSNGLYACKYRENMPYYRLDFQHNQKKYAIVSSSGCLHGAPWNVIIDGTSYVQTTGEIGTVLESLLHNSDVNIPIGDTAGMMMFDTPIEIDGYKASGDQTPAAWFDTEFRKDATFGGGLQYIEKLFGPLNLPEIACNQSKSNDCSSVSARYMLKFGLDFEFPIPLKYDNGSVSASIPPQPAFEALATASKSAIFKAWPKTTAREEPVKLTYSEPQECKMVHGLAKHFELPDDVSCATWTLTSKDFPTAIYYIGLQSVWLQPEQNYKTLFDSIRQIQGENHEKKLNYTQFQSPKKSMNLFVKLDGRPIAFVTKDGKTSIVQP